MNHDLLKLTAYFGERQRSGAQFTADALLGLLADSAVATSIVVRGIAGFGPKHELRTDVTLSASEDPPIAVAAVDRPEVLAPLASAVADLVSRGLVTLERARSADPLRPAGRSVKVTAYVDRGARVTGAPAHVAVCALLRRHGFFGASALLGVDGTAHGRRVRAAFFSRNVAVPAMVIGVGPDAGAAAALDELAGLPAVRMLTVEAVHLCKLDGALVSVPPATATPWQKLMVHTSASALHDGMPVHRALVAQLRGVHSSAGVTALRAVWGFQGESEALGDSVFRLGRQVPVTTIVVDSPERIRAGFAVIDALTTRHGLVTSEPVPAALWMDSGVRTGVLRTP
ncbi:DUF190 domain-containing protein [Mycobacterium sp. PS03-16]|uniref:DUF190 domain-containing protein n=1 Tax=Mycobacterium sp. PS03-16 TaxID=2559611 RepID=UPI0010749E81|nr:DUF190 domain-containing protein [Mycobacterium sp. PS03-16]TFV60264.1 DUF190 domain-containing protein [Mycobacterium sp. PS03-16]